MKARMECNSVDLVPESRQESDLLVEMAVCGATVADAEAIRIGRPAGFASTPTEELGVSVRLMAKPQAGG